MIVKATSQKAIAVLGALNAMSPMEFVLESTEPEQAEPTLQDLVDAVKRSEFEYESLKPICLAQWMHESGRGTSKLFKLHKNAGGMKWREEMRTFATPVEYMAHDGKDTYCKFESLDAWIRGYWRFIERSPYAGWRSMAELGPVEFITFLKASQYAEDPDYVAKVKGMLPEAEKLLGIVTKKTMRILLDPGHSSLHPGARSKDGTAREEYLTLMQANLIAEDLKESGHIADIFNPNDDSLTSIGKKAAGYNLFVSLHLNSYDGSEDPGTEVFVVRDASASDKAAAQIVVNEICKVLGTKNRGVKETNYTVIAEARKVCLGPVMLIESFFLNKYDAESAKKRAVQAADAITTALLKLLS